MDGKHYGVPYQWGPNVSPTTRRCSRKRRRAGRWSSRRRRFRTASRTRAGCRPSDGPIYIADAAVYLMKHRPELGIDDPYAASTPSSCRGGPRPPAQQRKIVGRYWHDATVQVDDFESEGVVASSSWPFQVNLLRGKNARRLDLPDEGATGWADTTMLHVKPPIRTAPTGGWSTRLNPRPRATSRPGSARCPVPAACQGNELLTDAGCATNGLRQFREDLVLANADSQVRGRGLNACPTRNGQRTCHPRQVTRSIPARTDKPGPLPRWPGPSSR